MAENTGVNQWKTLDKDLRRISRFELAAQVSARPMAALGVALAFIALAALVAGVLFTGSASVFVIVAASAFGAYMALNIGANDVANNMGPAVGARALSMGGALAIAAICETAGALLAGGDVVGTVAKGIVDPARVSESSNFIWAMMAALVASAAWVNLATWLGAPVSTTHAVVGGVLGAGAAAAGLSAVNWPTMGTIAASWVISPVLGGAIAALFLAFIKAKVIYVEDRIAAARVWVPVLIGVMAGTFAVYLALKGLGKVVSFGFPSALALGAAVGVLSWLAARPHIARRSRGMENRNRSLKKLFSLPLVVSAALLSFAHGANDVANAVGPLAAIVNATTSASAAEAVEIPLWVMVIGAFGISLGLFLFGPKLVAVVGGQITKLNPMRAYCVALSAAVTVILASWLGLPVSSTHIAIGAIFGVGFYREWHAERRARLAGTGSRRQTRMDLEERRRRKLVRRSHFMTIVAAWVITVPASAVLAAAVFAMLNLIAV